MNFMCCYLFTSALLGSGGCCVCVQTRVDEREVADCPLVDNLCNINTHDMVEGCFSCLFSS